MQEHIEELTGSVNAERRAELWATPHKRIFFMTPQTFKNDVFKGAHTPMHPCGFRRRAQFPCAGNCPPLSKAGLHSKVWRFGKLQNAATHL